MVSFLSIGHFDARKHFFCVYIVFVLNKQTNKQNNKQTKQQKTKQQTTKQKIQRKITLNYPLITT